MKIPLYCENRVLESFKMQYDYIFEEFPYPGIPLVNFNIIQNDPFVILGKPIIPIQVMHYKLPVFGFRFDSFAYITDANFIADSEIEKLKGVKVLVLNALRREAHISHFTLNEAVELALKIGAEQTYFTHMSHQIGLHDEVCNELPQGIDLAFDGQVIVI